MIQKKEEATFDHVTAVNFVVITFVLLFLAESPLSPLSGFEASNLSCLNFWDEACWFLSLTVFGLLSLSLLLFPQRFGRYVLLPSSGVCRTREHSQNFELRPFIWRLQVQSWLQMSNNTGVLNACTRLWLTESEQATPGGFNKGRSSKFCEGSRVIPTGNKRF